MLFSDYRFILQIFKNRLCAYKVDVSTLKIVETLEQEFGEGEDLLEKLAEVKKVFKRSNFFLLIPEEKTKLYLFKLPLDTKNVVGAVEEQLGLQADEKLSNLTYDLKKMGVDEEEGVSYHQAIVAQKNYLKDLKKAFDKAGVAVETIENPSFALARLTKNVKVPHCIYYKDSEQRVFLAAFEGEVFAAACLDIRKKLENAITEMVSEIKGRYGLEIKSILCQPTVAFELEDVKGLRVKQEDLLHPALGLALKKDLFGADLDVLSLRFPEVELKDEGVFEKMNKKLLLIPLLFLVLAAGFLLVKSQWGRLNLAGITAVFAPAPTATPLPSPSLSPTPQPTTTPAPTPLVKSELKVQILNGSGVVGVASRAQTFLIEDGWVIDSVANADRYDYENTQIKIKKSKEAYLTMLKARLSENFSLSETIEELPEGENVDAVVIIGRS